ncbi:MAG: helix-turn-helix domain-containing protein [Pseudomonadota bacterium]
MYVTSPVQTVESEIIFPLVADDSFEKSNPLEATFEEGANLFFAGDEAEFVYEVIEGVVKSSKVLMDGRRQIINFCYPGEMIGLSHDSIYHCDCEAVSKVRARIYRKNAFMTDLDQDPQFCARLLRNAAAEINGMQDHFLMLGRKTAMEKIASFLVAIMSRQVRREDGAIVFELPMKRSEIADFLGVTIETVSRNLTKLRKLGVIELLSTHCFEVSDPALLRKLAENDT